MIKAILACMLASATAFVAPVSKVASSVSMPLNLAPRKQRATNLCGLGREELINRNDKAEAAKNTMSGHQGSH